MKIALAADHGGFELKEKIKSFLEKEGHDVNDMGCHSTDSVDYPDYAEKAVEAIKSGDCLMGILICGTGIGMSIAANREQYIRAALCWDEETARLSREHNNANMLCIGARVLSTDQALSIIDMWLNAKFQGGRHQLRISKFSN